MTLMNYYWYTEMTQKFYPYLCNTHFAKGHTRILYIVKDCLIVQVNEKKKV